MLHFSLAGRLSLALLTSLSAFTAIGLVAVHFEAPASIAFLLALLVALPIGLFSIRRAVRPITEVLAALEDGVRSFQASDFSLRLTTGHSRELSALVDVYNDLASSLGRERSTLRQRELILHSVLESSPLSVLLVNSADRIILANKTARAMFFGGGRLEGHAFSEIIEGCPPDLSKALATRSDSMTTVEHRGREETLLVSRREFELNTRRHTLVLVRQMTQHLRRQEVAAWKRVIRTVSHELNNSLAPIRSLVHSARLIRSRAAPPARGEDQEDRLDEIFDHIDESAAGLHRFISSYVEFARLPEPRPQPISLPNFLERLQRREQFIIIGQPPELEIEIDQTQIEQVLVNLLNNAREAGSSPQDIKIEAKVDTPTVLTIRVLDRGHGMDSTTIEKALLPFYSEKKEGTGLGLALSQEILEAHGGRLHLDTREQGGLEVTCLLPLTRSSQ